MLGTHKLVSCRCELNIPAGNLPGLQVLNLAVLPPWWSSLGYMDGRFVVLCPQRACGQHIRPLVEGSESQDFGCPVVNIVIPGKGSAV